MDYYVVSYTNLLIGSSPYHYYELRGILFCYGRLMIGNCMINPSNLQFEKLMTSHSDKLKFKSLSRLAG
jgi:hypothetical protein